MEYKEIKKIIEDMENSKLDSLSIEFPDGVKISMSKSTSKTDTIETSKTVTVSDTVKKQENNIADTKKQENYKIVKSPMVGTFYESSSPNSKAFVEVGDKVKKGQVLCIIEAMKLMNEIESEYDGEIVEICVQNEEIVEYGMPLFKIK